MTKPTIGLIKEGKIPADFRVALTPDQCLSLKNKGWNIKVQSSEVRCFKDEEYNALGIKVVNNISDCDLLVGIKEVPIEQLIPNKTYLFFSHTIKKQIYNRQLLQNILTKNIRLIDYEVLTDDGDERLIAFGNDAGIVGAHMGIQAYGRRTGEYSLPNMESFPHYKDAVEVYKTIKWPPVRVVITGKGRVGTGAAMVLDDMGFKRLSTEDYLTKQYSYPVYTQIDSLDYVESPDGKAFTKQDYYTDPKHFKMIFKKYLAVSDIFINGIFWDNRSPAFFTLDELNKDYFNITTIADISCDIAPRSSVPTTVQPSTITNPVYGYDKKNFKVIKPFTENSLDVMAVDNLPNALPRDASESFGKKLMELILPEFTKDYSDILDRATIAKNGQLTSRFDYLLDFVEGQDV